MRSYNIHMYTDPYIIHVHTWSCLLGLKLALGLVQTILYSFSIKESGRSDGKSPSL